MKMQAACDMGGEGRSTASGMSVPSPMRDDPSSEPVKHVHERLNGDEKNCLRLRLCPRALISFRVFHPRVPCFATSGLMAQTSIRSLIPPIFMKNLG